MVEGMVWYAMQPVEALAELALAAKYMRGLRRREYEQLVANGALEGERVELLEGMIVHMSPHGPLHDGTLDLLLDQFRALEGRVRLRVQSAFAATDGSEPEPDLAVVPRGDYRAEHPKEAHLIVEVADSSLERDRTLKSRVYCQSGVPEYWIVNLVDSTIVIFRGAADGGYESVATHRAGDTISPIHFPELHIAVSDILSK
jgi:Uma2 family endonuclease